LLIVPGAVLTKMLDGLGLPAPMLLALFGPGMVILPVLQ